MKSKNNTGEEETNPRFLKISKKLKLEKHNSFSTLFLLSEVLTAHVVELACCCVGEQKEMPQSKNDE
jgi:hypothetical protein